MAGAPFKKRGRDDAPKSKTTRPSKKIKKQAAYHSSSEEGSDAEDADGFQAVNLLDSDEDDIHNAKADDGAGSDSDGASTSESETGRAPPPQRKKKTTPSIAKNAPKNALAKDAPSASDDDADSAASDNDDDDGNDEFSDLDDEADTGDEDEAGAAQQNGKSRRTTKSKRSDPDAFANSLSKILSTKLSSTRRADPVLARSAEAQEASRKAVDTALEQKARKKLRDQKRLALEKGRIRDVLVATNSTFSNVNPVTGQVLKDTEVGETTAQILETERRLRKVAQRGVVQLFNAFRTAQVKAAEAERVTKKEGVIGMDRKKEKVAEMSKKGFLDLIASGGGGLKKGPLEEA